MDIKFGKMSYAYRFLLVLRLQEGTSSPARLMGEQSSIIRVKDFGNYEPLYL